MHLIHMIMAQQLKIASLVKLYTMLLLLEGPKHGYELMKELEKRIGKKISASQVYPFLELLGKENFIKEKKKGSRDKITYAVTETGRSFTEKMLSRAGDLFYLAIKPQISVCTHCGCKLIEGGHKEVIQKKELMFCCHHCADSYKKDAPA